MHLKDSTIALLGAILGNVACGITLALVGSLESWIVADLQVPHALTGLMQSALFTGNLVGSLFAGWLMYRYNPRHIGVAAALLVAAGTLLSGLRIYQLVILARFISGLGYSGAVIFYSAVIVHAFPQRQAVYLNLNHATFALAAGATMLIARPFAALLGGWTATFWLGAVICLIPFLYFLRARLPNMREADGFSFRAITRVMSNRVIVAVLIVVVAYVSAEQALTVFLGSFTQLEHGLAVSTAAFTASLFWGGIMVGRLVSAFVSRRLLEAIQIVACTAAMAIFLLGASISVEPALLFAFTCLAGVFAGPLIPLTLSYAIRAAGQLQNGVVAMSNLTACIGGVFGPVVVGLIGDRAGLDRGMQFAAAVLLVSLTPFVFSITRASLSDRQRYDAAR